MTPDEPENTQNTPTPPPGPVGPEGNENPTPWNPSFKDRVRQGLAAVRDHSEVFFKKLFRGSKPGESGLLPKSLQERLRHVEFITMAEYLSQLLQRQGTSFYAKFVTIVLCCYFLADVLALTAGRFIPEPPAARAPRTFGTGGSNRGIESYNVIATRNLFNSQGLIPGEENPAGGPVDLGGAPVKTSLPLNLIGTLILRDELRSIATIEDKSASTVYPVRVSEEIPAKIRVVSIGPDRVVFVNLASGKREFVELPKDPNANNPRVTLGGPKLGGPIGASIQQPSPNAFVIPRAEVDKALADLNNILTQARAVPNIENGVPQGYKLFQIVPGSIYSTLGLQNGDAIVGMNNEPVNDPAKAFEALTALKTGNGKHLELTIKRDGKTFTNSYDVN